MNMLANLTSSDDIQQDRDVLGGSKLWETDVYDTTIKLAYLNKSEGGALALVIHAVNEEGSEIRFSNWITSGNAKGNLNYYEKDGKKHYLPGYNIANAICQLTVDKEINAMVTETKKVKLYNKAASAEVPTDVEVLVELIDQKVTLGVVKQTVNKQVKDGPNGYVMTNEPRDENDVSKVFHTETRKTVTEIRGQVEEAEFVKKWLEQNKGKTVNKFKDGGAAVSGGATGGAPKAAGAPAAAKKSLFSKE